MAVHMLLGVGSYMEYFLQFCLKKKLLLEVVIEYV